MKQKTHRNHKSDAFVTFVKKILLSSTMVCLYVKLIDKRTTSLSSLWFIRVLISSNYLSMICLLTVYWSQNEYIWPDRLASLRTGCPHDAQWTRLPPPPHGLSPGVSLTLMNKVYQNRQQQLKSNKQIKSNLYSIQLYWTPSPPPE